MIAKRFSFLVRNVIRGLMAVLMVFDCGACHPKSDKSPADKSTHDKSVPDISVLDKWFPDLSFLESDIYYIGKIDSTDYLVRFTNIHSRRVEGFYYVVGTRSEVEAEPFKGTFKRKRGEIKADDGQIVIITLYHTADNDTVYGLCQFDKREASFCFKRYQVPNYHTFPHRYQTPLFSPKVIKDVCYGSADGYWDSKPMTESDFKKLVAQNLLKSKSEERLSLMMDIYMPTTDACSQRPLLMLIHGGGFYFGDKTDTAMVKWGRYFASLGYVVASINYRMGFQLNKRSVERCGYAAVQDAHAAMRYLVSHSEQYNIDTNYLFVGGTSAGAITSLNLAFMRNSDRPVTTMGGKRAPNMGPIESSGNAFQANFKIRAVANMWGAVSDIDMIARAHTSIISFHGDSDRVVPYNYDVPFKNLQSNVTKLFFDKMYGSFCINQRAEMLGYRHELYTFHGAGHAPHLDKQNRPNAKCNFIQGKIAHFFFKEFLPCKPAIVTTRPQYYKINVSGAKELCWQAEGGVILNCANEVRVVWLKESPVHKLHAAGCMPNGASFETTLTVKN